MTVCWKTQQFRKTGYFLWKYRLYLTENNVKLW